MTTIAYDRLPAASEGGFLRRMLARLIAARQAEADRAVSAHLLALDDGALSALGFSRGSLEQKAGRVRI